MPVSVKSGSVLGVSAFAVEVEIDIQRGLPAFNVVGLPDRALQEARERVRSAINNSDFIYPDQRITINLAPANRRKEGPQIDLPIAIGILAAQGLVPVAGLQKYFFAGELALNGEVRPVRGILPLMEQAESSDSEYFIFPAASKQEIVFSPNLKLIPVENLQQTVRGLRKIAEIDPWSPNTLTADSGSEKYFTLPPLQGQKEARRAAAIAAAGNHNLMLFGPPGSGKTTIARTIPALMPPLTAEEKKEVMLIASAAGEKITPFRPWRDPHHSISAAGLSGGGRSPTPGEVTLAHRGILFLDELPEFDRRVLELMRQPLQDGYIHLVRHEYNIKLPADFMMIAALNPCPCGYFGQNNKSCRCTPRRISSYREKLSGPLLDRIDIQVEVPALSTDEIIYSGHDSGSREKLKARIDRAWQIQQRRNEGRHNGQLTGENLREVCAIGSREKQFLSRALAKLNLSRRGYDIILKLARTIADLQAEDKITRSHLAEAIQYRSFEREVRL